MSTVIVNGLKINTPCKFVKFTRSKSLSIQSDSRVLNINYPPGFRSTDIRNRSIEVVSDTELRETDYLITRNTIADINGLVVSKLSPYEYHFSQFILDDIKDYIMDYDEIGCTILIPKRKVSIESYVGLINKNPYLEVIEYDKLDDFNNIYGLMIKTDDIKLRSNNEFVFNSKRSYQRYLLRDVDILDSFILQVRSIMESYGIQVVSYPLSEETQVADRLIYKINELGLQESHKTGFEVLKDEVQKKSTIEFECTFMNSIIYEDFRHKYQNLDLLSNFTEFYTEDKLGRNWISNVRWAPLPADFNQDWSQDNQGNNAQSFTITCEVFYYVVYDRLYHNIKTIIEEITMKNSQGEEELIEVTIDKDESKSDSIIDPQLPDWLQLRN